MSLSDLRQRAAERARQDEADALARSAGQAGPAGPETAHTRFIPREELTSYASWTPRDFGRGSPLPGSSFQNLSAHAEPVPNVRRHKPWLPQSMPLDGGHRAPHPGGHFHDLNTGEPLLRGPNAAVQQHARAAESGEIDGSDTAADPNGVSEALLAQWRAEWEAGQAQSQADAQAQAEAALEGQLGEARQAGYQDGYRDGLAALDSFKESYAQQITAQVGHLVQGMDQGFEQLEQQLAEGVARIATALARQVLRSELASRPELITQVAQEALAALVPGARHVTLQLHPDDHALVARHCADSLQASGARIVARSEIDRGGCRIDSDAGSVDARIATRWAQAAAALGPAKPWAADQDETVDEDAA